MGGATHTGGQGWLRSGAIFFNFNRFVFSRDSCIIRWWQIRVVGTTIVSRSYHYCTLELLSGHSLSFKSVRGTLSVCTIISDTPLHTKHSGTVCVLCEDVCECEGVWGGV